MSTEIVAKRSDFSEVLSAIAEVDRLRTEQDILNAEADVSGRKADIARRVCEAYERQGTKVGGDVIKEAVDSYFGRRLVFKNPAMGLSGVLASLWIHRLVWSLCVFGVLLSVAITAGVIEMQREHEITVRTAAIEAAHDELLLVRSKTGPAIKMASLAIRHAEEAVGSPVDNENLRGAQSLAMKDIQSLKKSLSELESKFANEIPKDEPTPTSIIPDESACKKYVLMSGVVTEALRGLSIYAQKLQNQALDTTSHYSDLVSLCGVLESTWKDFVLAGGEGLMPATKQAVLQGRQAVGSFGAPENVRGAIATIRSATKDIARIGTLRSEIALIADKAGAASLEPNVKGDIVNFRVLALSSLDAGDLRTAQKHKEQLENIFSQIEQTYELRIVNRSDEYTRIWFNNPSRTGKLLYIVVEPVGSNGSLYSIDIVSEQDGGHRTVSRWAERVDEDTYETVGRDKKDDGVVQNSIFAQKERGYLNPRYLMGPKKNGGRMEEGRVYSWPRKS